MKTLDISNVVGAIVIEPSSLEEFADWKIAHNHKVICKDNVFWQETLKGFHQPLHILQKLHADQIHKHSLKNWGVRAALRDDETDMACGAIVFYTFESFKDFDFSMFSKSRRKNIRKCFREIEIKEIRDEKILLEQGYDVVKSALLRTQHKKSIPEEAKYLSKCNAYLNNGDNSHLVLGGFHGNRLLGYLEMQSVEETLYLTTMMVSTEGLKYATSPGLYYTAYLLGQRTKKIKEFYAGQPNPHDMPLCVFKKSMGQTLKYMPAICKFFLPADLLLRIRSPRNYHRLKGDAMAG